MTLVFADRVKESTTSTGTGPLTLGGAESGFRAFSSVCVDGDTAYYCVTDGTSWEVGLGTFAAGVLSRTSVLSSSNGGALVALNPGPKDVFLTVPASLVNSHSDAIEALQAATDVAALAAWSAVTTYNIGDNPVLRNGVAYAPIANGLLNVDPATDGDVHWFSGTIGSLATAAAGLSLGLDATSGKVAAIIPGMNFWTAAAYNQYDAVIGDGNACPVGAWSAVSATTATDVPGSSALWRPIDLSLVAQFTVATCAGNPTGTIPNIWDGQLAYDTSVSPPHGYISLSGSWVSLI